MVFGLRIKNWVPRSVRRWLGRWIHGAVFEGDFDTWTAARAASGGYEDKVILEKTIFAARAVRRGKAIWERDTVLFHERAYHHDLLWILRYAAQKSGNRLKILDFGGSLGSTWWQHKDALCDLVEVRWNIVEQPNMAAIGNNEFSSESLRFFDSLEACCAAEQPNIILLSSVLAYLEEPHRLLREIAGRGFQHIIIDRTGFVSRGRDRLTVQRVPASIYSASYPCWFFDREKLLRPFDRGWKVVADWPCFDRADIEADYRGIALEKIK